MTERFERDDVVEYGTKKTRFRVVAQDGEWLWMRNLASSKDASPSTGTASAAKKVAPFFEPGKLYRRQLPFSIRAQHNDVTEYLKVERVEENSGPGRSGRVAFGAVTFDKDGEVVTQWEIMGDYDWKNNGWREVGQ